MLPRREFTFSDIRHYLPYFLMLIVFVGISSLRTWSRQFQQPGQRHRLIASSLETLRLLSQIGACFSFTVGMELNIQHVREKGSAAVMISHASIIVPIFIKQ